MRSASASSLWRPNDATATTGSVTLIASLYGEKVRKLIDEHVTALDIATKIPPVSITDPYFLAKVQGLTSEKAKASEMEHALR